MFKNICNLFSSELWNQCRAEFFGTLVLVAFGISVGALLVFRGLKDPIVGPIGWGMGAVFGVLLSAHSSGAHLNPAVTLAVFFYERFIKTPEKGKKFSVKRLFGYVAAQVLGAFVGSLIVYMVYQPNIIQFFNKTVESEKAINPDHTLAQIDTIAYKRVGEIFTSIPKSEVPLLTAFLEQFAGAFLLVFAISAVCDEKNKVDHYCVPILVGVIIVVIGLTFGVNCGYPLNPARDWSPRLMLAVCGWGVQVDRYSWMTIVATNCGAIFGKIGYHYYRKQNKEEKYLPA